MAWSNSWDDKPKSPIIDLNWSDDKAKTFDTPKPFGQVMKEFNEEADKSIKTIDHYNLAIEEQKILNKPQIIIGVDEGSKDGDKTIVTLVKDGFYNVIGEDIELRIPEGWNEVIVKAIQIGDLAVIKSEDKHCIAHVPTQTWFDNAIPDGEYTVEQYCLWAWKVQQATGPNWTALREYNNSNYKELHGSLILEQIKCHCLSVPVSDGK